MSASPPDPSLPAAPSRDTRVLRAALWMFGTVLSFLVMMVAARELTSTMSSFQILFFRSLTGLAILLPLIVHFGIARLATRRPGLHLTRNVIHFAGQYGWVYGVGVLPLASVTALEFTAPICTAIIAALFLGEKLTSPRVVAIAIGFLGVLVILRPGITIFHPAALVVLGAAVCYGTSYAMVKGLTRTDAPLVILFYMQVMQLPLALGPALFDWATPAWTDAPWLILVGASALSAHYCNARAFMLADASLVIPLEFLRLPLIALVGWLFYSEAVDLFVILGAAMIFGGNYYGVWQESRSKAK